MYPWSLDRGRVSYSDRSLTQIAIAMASIAILTTKPSWGVSATASAPATPAPMVQQSQSGSIYIREYRVRGATRLPKEEIEEAVYPFLGPGRTPGDVEDARAALEKAYKDKGYQTVVVQVPPNPVLVV